MQRLRPSNLTSRTTDQRPEPDAVCSERCTQRVVGKATSRRTNRRRPTAIQVSGCSYERITDSDIGRVLERDPAGRDSLKCES